MANLPHLADGTLLRNDTYRIVRFLGQGGFGCTYEAEFEKIGVRVAIKEFFPQNICNRDATGRMSVPTDSNVEFVEKMRRKFVAEARTLYVNQDLDGVVKVKDIFDENGTSYFVMDFIDGRSIQRMIETDGPMSEQEALRLTRHLCCALKTVHAHGMLHLDIKPDNVMVGANGRPVLIDFGVSKQYSEDDGCNTSTLMGYTPGYAPLEQMNANVHAFLPATDIYALGATLYAMLTGNTPPKATDILNEVQTLHFPSHISPSTRSAIEAAMQPKVKDRPATVDAFLAILGGGALPPIARADSPQAAPAPKSPTTKPAPTRRAAPRCSLKDAAAPRIGKKWMALVAIVCVALGIWLALPGGKAHDLPDPVSDIPIVEEAVAVADTAIVETQPTQTASDHQPTKPTPSPEIATAIAPTAIAPTPAPTKVVAPASSTSTQTAMVAAYTKDGGDYRTYTLSDWEAFTQAQKEKVTPVGVQLTASGQKFIVALTDAANGREVKWEDKNDWKDCGDIPGLPNIDAGNTDQAKRDFNGRSNTNAILAYGRANGVSFPAASAAVNYSTPGHKMNWYLPASGQPWLMDQNKSAIKNVLSKIGEKGITTDWYWSSTEGVTYNNGSSSFAWYVVMSSGYVYGNGKANPDRVRAVAPVPSPLPEPAR